MRLFGWRGLLGLAVVTTAMVFGVGTASAAFHGIGLTKGCVSPVKIGDPYTCSVQILNVVDHGARHGSRHRLERQVNSAGGPREFGEHSALHRAGLLRAVTCTGGSGAGTFSDPTSVRLRVCSSFGSSITTTGFHALHGAAGRLQFAPTSVDRRGGVGWNNTCQFNPDNDCTTLPQAAGGRLVRGHREAEYDDGDGHPQRRPPDGDHRRGEVDSA